MTRPRNVTAELIPMTGASPRAALAAARALLAAGPDPRDASIAHQAAAIVLRDFGDVRAAIREFRLAARLARIAADPEREADVLTSLGTALVVAGRTEAGLAALDVAAAHGAMAGGAVTLGRILVRRGGSLYIAGRYAQAQADLRKAIALTHRAGEVIWEARARTAAALADLATAGMPADALVAVEAALADRVAATKRAELLLASARTALAAGHYDQSAERAGLSRSMFRAQQRDRWRAHAALVVLHARFLAGRPPGRLLPEARRVAARLGELCSDEAPDAWLLAGRIALAAGPRVPPAEAAALLRGAVGAARRRVPAFARAAGWLAEALLAEQHEDRRRLLAACRRGFGLLEEHLATLGAAELRAHATTHGAELAGLAHRAALRSGRPRLLLEWSERWRAVTLGVPPETGDPVQRRELAALRDVTTRLERAEPGGFPAAVLQRERLRLEAAVRARALRAKPGGTRIASSLDVAALLDSLGSARLLELVVVDGDLHVLVCGDGQIRRLAAGAVAQAAREVDFARFGLNRIARGRLAEPADQALAALAETGRRLDALLLGAACDHLGDGPVIMVPPGRLNAVPWGLLPSLAGRPVSVAPSARTWLRATRARPFGMNKVVLVSGPGLDAARAEVRTLAAEYGQAVVLAGERATTARVLEAIDGAGLAYIAAHGMFRADSPMFSSLRLADGPMTVHDLERLGCAPFRLILPSCDSGRLAPAGADELLGLASALLPLGTAGIVASVAQVGDRATAPLMLALHRRLRAAADGNGGLAAALRDARAEADVGDPEVTAAGWSFIALGA